MIDKFQYSFAPPQPLPQEGGAFRLWHTNWLIYIHNVFRNSFYTKTCYPKRVQIIFQVAESPSLLGEGLGWGILLGVKKCI